MDTNLKILSDVVAYSKYSKYNKEQSRRETWTETVDRNKAMHLKKYPQLKEEIEAAYKFVYERKVLPSMRSMQFAGRPIELSPNRIFNCAYAAVDRWQFFHEALFILLGGSGLGYSVQKHHIRKLPTIKKPSKRTKRFLVGDNVEGWADAIKVLMESYFFGKSTIIFDFSDIRVKGTLLKTSGGRAPGPGPLQDTIHHIRRILDAKGEDTKLTTIETHDIVCHIADCVRSGGIRPSALIALFSIDDLDMIGCKAGQWWIENPQRGRANNSAVLVRHKLKEPIFKELWKRIQASGSGEPGMFLTNSQEIGANPCQEIALNDRQFCNLTTLNASNLESETDFLERVKTTAFIGTLQAGYTDFHYLSDEWKTITEKEALLGVSMSGIASGEVLKYDLKKAAKLVRKENRRVANLIGIKPAARTTCLKPEGSSSLIMGCSSAIHAWHSKYYIRRVTINKTENLYTYLMNVVPDLMEDDYFKPHIEAKLKVPIKAPDGAIMRTESPIQLLERIKKFHQEWIKPGHRSGDNTHNVSATVSVKDDEWDLVGEWMWRNRKSYVGLSVLPYDGGTYVQAPFTECTQQEYEALLDKVKDIDLSKVKEFEDLTNLAGEVACAGGACDIK